MKKVGISILALLSLTGGAGALRAVPGSPRRGSRAGNNHADFPGHGAQAERAARHGELSGNRSPRNWVSVCSSADGTKLAAVVGGGRIYTSGNLASGHYLTGEQFSAIELQYVGNNTFMQLSSTGAISFE